MIVNLLVIKGGWKRRRISDSVVYESFLSTIFKAPLGCVRLPKQHGKNN